MVAPKRRRAESNPIDTANKKSDADFIKDYLEPKVPEFKPWATSWSRPGVPGCADEVFSITCASPANMDEETLEECFELVEITSSNDYEMSTQKWRPGHKRKEMRSPDLKYIVVRGPQHAMTPKNPKGPVLAFTSLMPAFEEGHAVVYCYEIHISRWLQGDGLGRLLLGYQSIVAHNLGPPVSKVMLTCFLSNYYALGFYKKLGFKVDESAPKTRELRGGKTFVPDYTILSKAVVRKGDTAKEKAAKEKPAEKEQPAQKEKPAEKEGGKTKKRKSSGI
ncbi:N alpha-acetyl-transferase [Sporothrix stenoceras]|uniref:N-alpha-acetyltransferase 40 n=1 Tax=Sporothrix stenoceras TaxID=5173 RepID=A0ABR3YXZ7_9PEZI